jgi:hypothetical protein
MSVLPTAPPPRAPRTPDTSRAALARLGITRVATEHFDIGPYRYARLADALAEARRAREPGNDR